MPESQVISGRVFFSLPTDGPVRAFNVGFCQTGGKNHDLSGTEIC